jgi:hypothetical protein
MSIKELFKDTPVVELQLTAIIIQLLVIVILLAFPSKKCDKGQSLKQTNLTTIK